MPQEGGSQYAADSPSKVTEQLHPLPLSRSVDELDRKLSDKQFTLLDSLDHDQRLLQTLLEARRSRDGRQMELALNLCELRGQRNFGGEL